jgi:hypothetical protein
MTDELERMWIKVVVDDLRYYLRLRLNELAESSRTRRQVSQSSGRYLNPGPPDYEAVCYRCVIRSYGDGVKIWIGEGA